jgi:hypothetical protein
MKKSILIVAVLLGSFLCKTADAQVRIGLNFNIGTQPVWGPTGYDHVDNYYIPDIDVFYNVQNRQYTYLEGGRWTFSSSLPPRYRNYDLYSGHKVVVNEDRPYRHAQDYRERYAEYKGRNDQEVIRNSHDPKYFENEGHPEHEKWKHDNGNHNGSKERGDNNDKKQKGRD